MGFQLARKHTKHRLTWQGWLLVLLVFTLVSVAFTANLYGFLAPDKPPKSGLLVVEGWINDYAIEQAVLMFREGNYSKIVCTGGPIETGSYIQPFKTYPEMTATRLRKLGIPEDRLMIAIADDCTRDRTYQAAVALREAIIAYNIEETRMNLVTTGPHGRRSRMLFQKALGKDYLIGVTSFEESSYEARDWYKCSEGVRTVIGELIAFCYAKFFFHP